MNVCGRGIAQITFPGIGLQSFAFYNVDATRIRLLSNANGVMLSGDAVSQKNVPATLNSGFAFIVAGSSGSGGITRVGRFTANGATLSNVLVDSNDNGKFIPTNSASDASITLDPVNPGRGSLRSLMQASPRLPLPSFSI